MYPRLFVVSLLLCLHLPWSLGPGLRSALAEPLLSEKNVSLRVTPATCVALHKGQRCFQQLTLSWRTPTGYRLCLFGDSSSQPLHCSSAVQTEFQHEYRSQTAESFVLRQGESGPVVSQVSVTTAWVYRTGKRSSSGWRLLALSTLEFDILLLLASNVGQCLGREALIAEVRGIEYDGFDRSVDVCISRLRRKLGDDAQEPRRIKTLRGVGYLLAADAW